MTDDDDDFAEAARRLAAKELAEDDDELGDDTDFVEAMRRVQAAKESPVAEAGREQFAQMAQGYEQSAGFFRGAAQKSRDIARGLGAMGKAVGQIAPKLLEGALPGAAPPPEPLTEEEKQVLYKSVLPMAGQVATAVGANAIFPGAGALPSIARGVLNFAAPMALHTAGRNVLGEPTTIEDLITEATLGIVPGTVTGLSELPASVRLAAALPAGEAARRLRGEETTILDVLLDAIQPGALSAAGGVGKGIRGAYERPLSSLRGYVVGETPLEESLYPYGHRAITGRGKTPRIETKPERSLLDRLRQIVASPMHAAEKSERPEFGELRGRFEHFTYEGGQKFAQELGRARERLAAMEAALKGQDVDTELTSYLTDFAEHLPGFQGPPREGTLKALATPGIPELAAEQARTMKALRTIGERVGMFTPEAPPLEFYGGPNILKPSSHTGEQQELLTRTQTLARRLQPKSAARRRMQVAQRTGAGWNPERHIGSPTARLDEWIRMYRDKVRAAASFGAISTGNPANKIVEAVKKLEAAEALAPPAGQFDLFGADTRPHLQVADLLERAATTPGAAKGKGAEKLMDLANYLRLRHELGDTMTAEEMIPRLRQLSVAEKAQAEPAREFGRYGQDLITRLRQQGVSSAEEMTLTGFEDWLKHLYQTPGPPGEWDELLGKLGQGSSTIFLSKSGPRQVAQSGMNPTLAGIGNTAEGLTRRFLDPSFGRFQAETGAGSSPMQALFKRMNPEAGTNLVGKSIGLFEKYNRLPAASGYVPYIEKLLDQINAGVRNRAVLRQARELGIDLGEDLTPTAPLMENLYRRGVGRAQGMWTEPGYSSYAMTGTPVGRTFTQFMPYSLGQARRMVRDIAEPIGSGIRYGLKEGDFSELALGLDRLARAVPSALGATAVANTLTGIQQAKPEQGSINRRAFEVYGGMPANVIGNLYDADLFNPNRTWSGTARGLTKALGKTIQPPSTSFLEGTDPVTAGTALATAINPTFGSAVSLASPFLRTLTKPTVAGAQDIETPLERTPINPERPAFMPGVSTPGLSDDLYENLPEYLRGDPFMR